jgi:hypothetical protein
MNPAVMAFNFNDAVQCKRDGSCSKPTFAWIQWWVQEESQLKYKGENYAHLLIEPSICRTGLHYAKGTVS